MIRGYDVPGGGRVEESVRNNDDRLWLDLGLEAYLPDYPGHTGLYVKWTQGYISRSAAAALRDALAELLEGDAPVMEPGPVPGTLL